MVSIMAITLKSPVRKLNVFFKKSRDKWKNKAKEANNKIRLQDKQILYLQEVKQVLKDEIKNIKEKQKLLEKNLDGNSKKKQQKNYLAK